MNGRRLGRALGCSLCAILAWACSGGHDSGDSPARPNLVLVVLDTTRPDLLSAYGYSEATTPFLDTFASQATRFERAYSSSCWTLPAHATMFSGELPGVHRATQSTGRIDASVPLLAEILNAAGYATAGFSVNPWIGKKSGLSRGFETFERIESTKQSWLAGETSDKAAGRSVPARRVSRWLRKRGEGTRPFFLFVNLMRAHHPFVPTPQAGEQLLGFDPPALRGAIEEFYPELPGGHARSLMNRHYAGHDPLSPEEWERLGGLYKASLRSVDDELRAVLAAVDRSSEPESTLVLVVSDHGESLGEHGHFGHILNLYETSLRVVFLARGPGFGAGLSDDRPVHLADVHATLLAAAQVAPDSDRAPGAGLDLARPRPDQRVLAASLEGPRLQLKPFTEDVLQSGALDVYRRAAWTAIGGRYKLILRSDDSEELYDLQLDPEELRPLAADSVSDEHLTPLRESVQAQRSQMSAGSEAELEFDAEMLESLRGLGYVK